MIKIIKEMIMEEIVKGRALDHYTTLASSLQYQWQS